MPFFLLSLAKLSILFFCRQVHLGVGVHRCYEAVKRTLILCKLRLVCWTVALGDWALREQVVPRGRLHSIFSSAPLLCTAYWITALYHHICPTIEKLSQGHHELSRAISHWNWYGLNEGHNDEEYWNISPYMQKMMWCCGEGYFGQKKIAEKVRKSRQNVNRDKSA